MTIIPRRPTTHADRPLEWLSAGVMVAWSVILAIPGDSLGTPQFAAFHREPWMTEAFWAAVFGFVGAGRAVALFINGRSPRTPYARMVGAFFGFLSWAQVAVAVTTGGWAAFNAQSTGLAPYGALALCDLYSIFRAAYDARYAPPR